MCSATLWRPSYSPDVADDGQVHHVQLGEQLPHVRRRALELVLQRGVEGATGLAGLLRVALLQLGDGGSPEWQLQHHVVRKWWSAR